MYDPICDLLCGWWKLQIKLMIYIYYVYEATTTIGSNQMKDFGNQALQWSMKPYIAIIKFVKHIVGPKVLGKTCHVVINHDGNVSIWEGQNYGIIPPCQNPKMPSHLNSICFYSIASTRYGDNFDGKWQVFVFAWHCIGIQRLARRPVNP